MRNSIKSIKLMTVAAVMAGLAITGNAHAGVKTYLDWFGNSIVEISDTNGIGTYHVIDGSTGATEKQGYFAAEKQGDCPKKITVNLGGVAKHKDHFHNVIYGACSATLVIKKFNARGDFTSVPTAAEQVGLMSSGETDEQASYSEFERESLSEDKSEPSIILEYGNDETSLSPDRRAFSLDH